MCTKPTLVWFKHSGGDPHASAQSASVILADPNTDVFQHLIKTYQGVADKYIESYLWVKKCIEKGSLVYTPLVYKNPGGRRPGEEYVSPAIRSLFHKPIINFARRTQFTEQDEQHLCNWIAAKIPYKETGGRTGNRLYQQLCDLVSTKPPASFRTGFSSVCILPERGPRICMGCSSYLAILEREV